MSPIVEVENISKSFGTNRVLDGVSFSVNPGTVTAIIGRSGSGTPSLRVATNTPMFKRMELDMDFNTGAIVDGDTTIAESGQALFELMLKTASGAASKRNSMAWGTTSFCLGSWGRDVRVVC